MKPQRAHSLAPDQVLGGKYRILSLIGEGGMGGVYEAENELTQKRVAIKWLHPSLAASSNAVARMLREAQASARVRHPHVVDVYDVGQEQDSVFLVMEFLEGETLRSVMASRRLPIAELLSLLVPAMRGVAAAHARGIIHRDVKPDNIFLARVSDYAQPVPKVLDFGISKFDAAPSMHGTLTQSGMTMGTPLYMSFEQLSGAKDVDARTDVYAFAVILYEALAGRPPFQAESFGALAVKMATTTPTDLRALNPEVPEGLSEVIRRGMSRERDARYESLDAMIAAIEPYLTASESHGQSPLRGQTRISNPTSGPIESAAFARTVPEHAPHAKSRGRTLAAAGLLALGVIAAYAYFSGADASKVDASVRDKAAAPAAPPPVASPPPPIDVDSQPAPAIIHTTERPDDVVTPPTEAPLAARPDPTKAPRDRARLAPPRVRRAKREVAATPAAPQQETAPPANEAPTQPAPAAAARETADDGHFRAGQPKLDEF